MSFASLTIESVLDYPTDAALKLRDGAAFILTGLRIRGT
jgi:hypothetical protein